VPHCQSRPTGRLERRHQGGFGLVPDRVVADALVGPIRELDDDVRKAEILVDRQDHVVDLERFLSDLALGDEDVRIILREGAHAHQSM